MYTRNIFFILITYRVQILARIYNVLYFLSNLVCNKIVQSEQKLLIFFRKQNIWKALFDKTKHQTLIQKVKDIILLSHMTKKNQTNERTKMTWTDFCMDYLYVFHFVSNERFLYL